MKTPISILKLTAIACLMLISTSFCIAGNQEVKKEEEIKPRENTERTERRERTPRAERAERQERSPRAERSERSKKSNNIQIGIYSVKRSKGHIIIREGTSSYEIKFKGDIVFTDDDKGIKSISDGGYLEIYNVVFGTKRRIEITSENNKIQYKYYERNKEKDFETEGRKWLEDFLIDVIRTTGIGADERAIRIYTKDGIVGFIDEMNEISSNSVQTIYYNAILVYNKLHENDIAIIANKIGKTMSSNTDRAHLYKEHSKLFLKTDEISIAFFNGLSKLSSNTDRSSVLRNLKSEINFKNPEVSNACFNVIRGMSSNTDRTNCMIHFIDEYKLPENAQIDLLEALSKLSSNTDRARVLKKFGRFNFNNTEIVDAYFYVINKMTSNTDRAHVIINLLEQPISNAYTNIKMLEAIGKFSSNTDRANVLIKFGIFDFNNTEIVNTYCNTLNHMSSNVDRANVLIKLFSKSKTNAYTLIKLLDVTSNLSSNTDKTRILNESLNHIIPGNQEIANAYENAFKSMTSNTDRASVMTQLLQKENLTETEVTMVLRAVKNLSSNTDKARVMIKACAYANKNKIVRELYKEVAKSLTSNSEYRSVMECLN